MSTVYALVEHLPVGASGLSQENIRGEYPGLVEAVEAKVALYQAQPALLGCLTIEVRPQAKKEAGGGGAAAAGAERGGDGVQGAGGGGGHPPDVPALRPAGGRVPGPAVERAVPRVPEAGDQ